MQLDEAIQDFISTKDYVLREQLAFGELSQVYKVYHSQYQRYDVLKILREQHCQDSVVIKRFFREAETLAPLSHPNLVKIHENGSRSHMHYILMECVEGLNLSEYIKKYSVSLQLALKIIFEVGSGLNYLLQNHLIHRDIKPANIMITRDRHIKIIDFGLAKSTKDLSTHYSVEGAVLGTPEYMSPEQAMGLSVDFRTDIYSLGIIFYELLASRPPFQGDFPEEVIYKQRNCEHISLRKLDRRHRQGISNIVDKMLAKNPDDRFQSIDSLLQRLKMEKYLLEKCKKNRQSGQSDLEVY